MAFYGLFVGIDRYASPSISWLNCAKRDAIALHALFTDAFGGETTLLVDQDATCSAIQEQLMKLSLCDYDDVVVVTFSGHGSETHQLVTYDTEIYDLENTSIALERLSELVCSIPTRHLICVLDCCFSGGMGAKVLHVETTARGLKSTENLLSELSGEGRLILTASSATEPAYENARYGHGLLTYHLLEALQGAEEVQQAGKLPVYQLLDFVTKRVIDASTQLGQTQHPTVRGQFEGELLWPIFKPGKFYFAAFPERAQTQVTTDIYSLESYGFPTELLRLWASNIPSLNLLQIDAINEYKILEGENLVVSAPTSSGKTMIGELAALKGALERKRGLFLLPLKALVNDKLRSFIKVYGAFGILTIAATGETDDITPLLRGQYDLCLMTYEKFAAVVLSNPHILNQVGTIVIDEVQMIADEFRGVNLEFILTLLRVQRQHGINPQIIALSAVIGDTNGLERWLGARLLRRNERPIPLDEGLLLRDGSFHFIDGISGKKHITEPLIFPLKHKGTSQDWVIPLVQKLVSEGQQVIVFRETKGEARGCAQYLARALNLPPAQEALAALPGGDRSKASEDLHAVLQGGIAFHTSELAPDERRVVEEHFRAEGTTLRVIAATTTLAMGINTPASSVIVVGLNHPAPNNSTKPYSIAEYKNLVGRAGRLGYAEKGTSYLLALTPHDQHYLWQRYVGGEPEDLVSRFLSTTTDPRSLIIRVLTSVQQIVKRGISAEDINEFLEASFGAFQQTQASQSWQWSRSQIIEAIQSLLTHGLVEQNENGFYCLTALGQLTGQAGVEVESIIRIINALAGLDPDSIHEPTLLTAVQLTVELDQMLFPINRRSTNKEPLFWRQELQRQNVPSSLLNNLAQNTVISHQATLRAKKAIACLFFVTQRSISDIEAVLTQFGGSPGGAAGAIRDIAARTSDLLPTVSQIASILHPSLDLEERVERLLIRLSIGLPPACVDLAKQIGNQLTRGDYLQLVRANLCGIEAIESSSDSALLICLSNDHEKLEVLRQAVKSYYQHQRSQVPTQTLLEPFEV